MNIDSLKQVCLESSNPLANVIPVDTSKIKNPDQVMLCANTHIMNVLVSTITTAGVTAGIKLAIGDGIASVFRSGLFTIIFNMQAMAEQLFARDFVMLDKNLPYEFSDDALGLPILSVNDGTVIAADKMRGAYGNVVMIQHDDHCYSAYGHLQTKSMLVKAGDKVRRGQRIGSLGNTGNSSAPHLHFEMLYTNPNSNIPILPTKIGRPLNNFCSHPYIPLDMSEVYLNVDKKVEKPSFSKIFRKMTKWEVNHTGDIPSFCLIRNK